MINIRGIILSDYQTILLTCIVIRVISIPSEKVKTDIQVPIMIKPCLFAVSSTMQVVLI